MALIIHTYTSCSQALAFQRSEPPHLYDIQQIITEVASSDSDILTFIVIHSSFSGITFLHPINFFPFREDNCQDDHSSWCTEIMNFPTDLRFQLKKYIIHFHCRLRKFNSPFLQFFHWIYFNIISISKWDISALKHKATVSGSDWVLGHHS